MKTSSLIAGVVVATAGLLLAGCTQQTGQRHAPVDVGKTSRRIMNRPETIWGSEATITGATKKAGVISKFHYAKTANSTNVDQPWITHNGKINTGYVRIGYGEMKAQLKKYQAGTTKAHFATINQLNQALKAAKASISINKYGDLTYFASANINGVQAQGFIAAGHHLYALNLQYGSSGAQFGDVDVASVFSDAGYKHADTHLSNSQISGNWLAVGSGSTDQLRVMNGQGYNVKSLGAATLVNRFNIQDLKSMAATNLYTTTYMTNLMQAMNMGYSMPKAATRAGSDAEYTYLFISPTRMVRLKDGEATIFAKTKRLAAMSKVPAPLQTVLAAADKQVKGEYAGSVGRIEDGTYEVCFLKTLDMLTNKNYMQANDYQDATVTDGKVTFKEMQ